MSAMPPAPKLSESILPPAGHMQALTHILPIRVYYEDTDFSGRVYHASYLRFFERGRTEFLRHAGFSHQALANESRPSGFSVVSVEAQFQKPAQIDDMLNVQTRLQMRQGPCFSFAQRLTCGSTLISTAILRIVPIWLDGAIRRPARDELDVWDKLLCPDPSFLKQGVK